MDPTTDSAPRGLETLRADLARLAGRLGETLPSDEAMTVPALVVLLVLSAVLLALLLTRPRPSVVRAEAARLGAAAAAAESRAERAEALLVERAQALARAEADGREARAARASAESRVLDLSGRVAALTAQLDGETARLAERDRRIEALDGEIAALRARVETELAAQRALQETIAQRTEQLDATRKAADDKIALLSGIQEEMRLRFQELSAEVLRTQGEAFGKTSLEKLDATLTPLREHVAHFEKALQQVHQDAAKDREALKAEIRLLSAQSEAVSKEAVALTRALKGDRQKQGAWGEMILEGILERSGLRAGEEYEVQVHRTGAEGERLRPDVVVRIPGDRTLVIDAKVSLNDYAASVNAEDETQAAGHRQAHLRALRAHIDRLAGKGYHLAEATTVDYVILFVPIEGALSEALREDGGLTTYALERHIAIATPTTLMMALRTVAHVWAVERRNRNAEAIASRAGQLYDKVAGFVASMEKVGKGLGQAQSAYDGAMGQLARGRGNLLRQVEMLRELGAKSTRSLGMAFEGDDDPALPSGPDDGGEPAALTDDKAASRDGCVRVDPGRED